MPPSAASPATDTDFADDARCGLSAAPRRLSSRYLYDGIGSALFDAICELPWYKITRTERALLTQHARDIFRQVGDPSTLVELGPGAGDKLVALMAAHDRADITVHLIDISPAALDAAVGALATYPNLTIVRHESTYEDGLAAFAGRPRRDSGRTMALCLGSNIGNFDPAEADALLGEIHASLLPGDSVLLGADLVKPEEELLLAYDDPLGVTAAFNRNLLVRANREFGADFDLAGFAHRAVWNAGCSRVEMHLVSLNRQRVRAPRVDLDITFETGETIWTESSYKYTPTGVVTMLDRAGFEATDQWVADGFALTLGFAR